MDPPNSCCRSCECAAGSLWPCNPRQNYSVTVWNQLCQNSSDSKSTFKGKHSPAIDGWSRKIYINVTAKTETIPFIGGLQFPTFLSCVRYKYGIKSQFQSFSQLTLPGNFCPRSIVCVPLLGEGQSLVTNLVFASRLPDAFPVSV